MVSQRLEVRLDPAMRQKLEELARVRSLSISDAVREAIDRAHDEAMVAYRLELVRQIGELNIEDVPDPETLSRQLDETHDAGIP
jgi:hypothetical protein